MITQEQEARIYGYHGPYFPSAVDSLNGHFMRFSHSLARTKAFCELLGKIVERPQTSDEYEWGWAVSTTGNNLVVIPDFGDPGTWDGRSIAVYNPLQTSEAKIQEDIALQTEILSRLAARFVNEAASRST